MNATDSLAEPPRKSRVWRFIAVVIIIVLAVVGFLTYFGAQATLSGFGGKTAGITSSTNSSTIKECCLTTKATPSGVELLASTNGTTFRAGQELAVTATLFNPSGQNYNISVGNIWPFNGLLMLSQSWPYCYFYSPIELLVLKGNFSVAGVIATVNSIGPNTTSGMFCYEYEEFSSFRFEPESSLVYVASNYSVTGSQVSVTGPLNASVTVSTNGYWENSTLLYLPSSYTSTGNYYFLEAQHPFVEGVYTLAVGDEWGRLVVIHFTVE